MRQADIRTLRREIVNPFARLLPLGRFQSAVYRYAERNPPGLAGYQPRWEAVNAVLGAQQTLQVRVDLPTDFHLLAILASATVNTVGGFRVHFYDQLKKQRIGSDRGIQFPNLGGASGSAFFLPEPYEFNLPDSQMLVMLQNLESASNTVSVVFYGPCLPFVGKPL